jgi:proteasome lid subunit RPN8/RPN11
VIRLDKAHLDLIRAEAERAWPAECCGILVGCRDAGGAVLVTSVHPAPNLMASEREDRFEIDPRSRLQVMRQAEAEGLEMVGHYHSHPNGREEPSPSDLAMAHEPDLIWMIAPVSAGRAGQPRAFRVKADGTGFEIEALEAPQAL